MEIFKKGQMVVKRLGLIKPNKSKMLHLCTFGADVQVDGKRITVIGDGPAIYIKRNHIGGMRGKPKEMAQFLIHGVHVTTKAV